MTCCVASASWSEVTRVLIVCVLTSGANNIIVYTVIGIIVLVAAIFGSVLIDQAGYISGLTLWT